jgi:hypothetical protein
LGCLPARLVDGRVVGGVIGAVGAHDLLGLRSPVARVDSHQGPTATELLLIVFGVVLRNTHSREGAADAADCAAGHSSGDNASQQATGDNRPDAGYKYGRQGAQQTADDTACE